MPDALYHLLWQAASKRVRIEDVRVIMPSVGDTLISVAMAFVSAYNCTLKPCTESFKKEGGPALHLLKQIHGYYLVILHVHQHNASIDLHAVAYNGSVVLDNSQCASLASTHRPPAAGPPVSRRLSACAGMTRSSSCRRATARRLARCDPVAPGREVSLSRRASVLGLNPFAGA